MKKRKIKIAVVSCSGGSPLKPDVTERIFENDCATIKSSRPDGIYDCAYGCLGGGACVKVCKFNAITINKDQIAAIDRDLCIGCGVCVKACPQNIIHLAPSENVIDVYCSNMEAGAIARKHCLSSCIACRICEKNCPADAIHIVDNISQIDHARCIACGMCAIKCPKSVIHDADGVLSVAL